ncbi:MAG: hypothetical protein P794_08005 [Epsilonproteobacteria bacterium (ex Lamellibrachia satsuma)]|nr:MAG: hypothetical protein P794_08005 [Epsilonproteobacteria bacterium (ex Lamellibrachia satsuma)]
MSLFQRSVLRNYLKNIDTTSVAKAYETYKHEFLPKIANIKTSKEEQYQYGFLDDLFVKVLGYTLNPTPNYNLIAEQKNISDSKKADGAVLKDGKVIAVIELKSTKTKAMDKIVDQAFNYKNNHPACKYIITSNFEKLRFYVEYSDRYEEFNLFTLDEEQFTLLYYLLNKENLFADIPLKLKADSKLQEENISNELYKKYAGLRTDLFENIIENNLEIDRHLLLEKTQTILDRMVFIFFAEDRGILPPNTIQAIIDHYKDDIEDRDLWHFYKIYFKAINQGNKKLNIPEYNGGLFAADEVLESLKIDNHVIDACPLALSAYDFNSDIDVNILGHIFENSLNDIEELKARINDIDFDASKSKRKKEGIFYTPEYITKYIVDNTLGSLCQAKKEELGLYEVDILIPKNPKKLNRGETKQKEALEAYKEYLLGLKILDPACGSGAFLNQALNYLLAEHAFIDEGIRTLMGGFVLGLYDVKKGILENNLYGVDINTEAVEIAKLSLWLRTVENGRKLNKLADKIKVGNSLIDDRTVADDAFVWEEEFSEVFVQGGFDVVIGNPPYIRVQGLKSNYANESEYYEKHYMSAVGNYDIYVIFMERSFTLLNERGRMSFILPHKFLVSSFGKGIRKFLVEHNAIESLLHFGSNMVFEDASAYTSIVTLSHDNKIFKFINIEPSKIFESTEYEYLKYKDLGSEKWNLSNQKVLKLLDKLNQQPFQIKDKFKKIFQGLKTGADKVFVMQGKISNNTFIGYSEALNKEVIIEKDLVIPLLKGDDIDRYKYIENSYYVVFPYQLNDHKAIPLLENEIKSKYPLAYDYLNNNSTYLRQREKGRFDNSNEWFLYSRNQGINDFNQPKIVFQEMGYGSKMSYDHKGYCVIRQYSMIKSLSCLEDYKFYLALFNSSLMWFFIKHTSTELRGGYFMYQTKYLEPFPLPKIENLQDEIPFVQVVDKILDLNKTFQFKKNKFQKRLTDNFDLDKPSKKLEAFYELDFKTFLKELKKKKVTLTLKEQDEWEEYFDNYKKELIDLQTQIDNTDKEIDVMVYTLYGLTEEEIAVVEGKA